VTGYSHQKEQLFYLYDFFVLRGGIENQRVKRSYSNNLRFLYQAKIKEVFIMDQFEIVAVRHDEQGRLTQFKLSDGREINFQQAVEMGKRGQIRNIDVVDRASGRPYIRSERDGSEANNLDSLPEF
jgi:hypothetical protein